MTRSLVFVFLILAFSQREKKSSLLFLWERAEGEGIKREMFFSPLKLIKGNQAQITSEAAFHPRKKI
ncbi:MAG: hypothetical protein DRI32_02095 [Chloroflexi bacterium]|nr:MAG: hypothetical protein DRI32_02095 [Chloroflexota bacterium]